MSRENVEIVRRLFDASARNDSDAVLALYHPDVEWDAARWTIEAGLVTRVVWFPTREDALEAAGLSGR